MSYNTRLYYTDFNYHLGGMEMKGRNYQAGSSSYRYGFGNKEMDNEFKGDGNSYYFGERIYDPRVSRWLSIDKMQKKYPSETPYLYTGGNPIYFIDPDGKDRIVHTTYIDKSGTTIIKTETFKNTFRSVMSPTYDGGYYFTKNDYEVNIIHDYRSGKDVKTETSTTLYGSNHATKVGVWEWFTTKFDQEGKKLPPSTQVLLFGAGSSDLGLGDKANPDKPITSIDLGTFNSIMGLIITGAGVPDLKGADPDKIPELVDKYKEIKEARKEKDELGPGNDSCEVCHQVKEKGTMSKEKNNDGSNKHIIITTNKTKQHANN